MKWFALGAAVFITGTAVLFVSLFAFYPIKYKTEIREAAALYSVDKVLVAGIINAESGFKKDAVSAKGAVGLMQIMPPTADYIAAQTGWGEGFDLRDPRTNIMFGTYYLRYLLDKFGDTKTALIAYNAGEGNVTRWLADARVAVLTTSPYKETNAYVDKVLNSRSFYRFRV